ncbi:MAG: hypothetical protein WCI05_14240, partial [Myxococcales bacterium]
MTPVLVLRVRPAGRGDVELYEVATPPGSPARRAGPTRIGWRSRLKGTGASAIAYVSSIRDREIVVVPLNGAPGPYVRIAVKGQPNKMTMNGAQSLLYVAEDQS